MLLGKFISSVISFVIIAFVLFLVVKGANTALRKKEEKVVAAPSAPPADILLLTEIRDLLKK
jgi:large conductance mechanosensitive channel